MKDSYDIKFKCVFCGCEKFSVPRKNYKPIVGERIKCANCGRLNDYESLQNLAVKEGINIIKSDLEEDLKKMFKKAGLRFK